MRALATALSCALLLAACGGSARARLAPPSTFAADAGKAGFSATVPAVPFHAQRTNHCGPATLAMALGWSGIDVAPDALAGKVYTEARRGSLQTDLVSAARRHGRIAYEIRGARELDAALDEGIPIVVLQNLALRWWPRWHYALALARDPAREEIILHSGMVANRRVSRRVFDNTWSRAGQWGLLVLAPDRVPSRAVEAEWIAAVLGLERAHQWRAAAVAYRAALDRWPDSLAAAVGLGNAFYALGELEAAQAALQIAVNRHAHAAPAWNNLAHVLAERGRHGEALAAARRAMSAAAGTDSDVYRRTLSEIQASP
jgi:tetratricopeptide (TPR) repeat protein